MNFLLYYIKEKPQFAKRPTQSDPIFLTAGFVPAGLSPKPPIRPLTARIFAAPDSPSGAAFFYAASRFERERSDQ
jgi:hypothetical protein